MKPRKIRFMQRNNSDFYVALKTRINEYFKDNNISKYANQQMVFKTVFWLTIFFTTYFLILFSGLPKIVLLILAGVYGYAMLLLSLNIGHDASHNAYSSNSKINRKLSYVFELIGASSYLWDIMHNRSHHSYINIHESDVAIDADPFLRLSYDAPLRPIQRYQHIYGLFVYGMATLFWVLWKDFRYIRQPHIGPFDTRKHPIKEYLILIIGKLFYFGMNLVIPMLLLDISFIEWLAGFILMHFVMGLTLALTFQTTHAVEETQLPKKNAYGDIENSWAQHVLEVTSDYRPNSKLLNFLYGGLNTHVAHHLFPDICHIHYPAITRIIKSTSAEFGLRYVETPSMWTAIYSHLKHLRSLGRYNSPPNYPNPVNEQSLVTART